MPISQNKYVSITSSQGGESAAKRKDLILRVFTSNELFPTGTVLEFATSAEVSAFAGANALEAKIASEYFGWVSKQTNKAKKISFMRYAKDATKPYLRSSQELAPLLKLKEVTNGSMILSMGGVSYEVKNLSFTEASSYADIASAIQSAVVANVDGGELWTGAEVTYDAELSAFVLTGGEAGKNIITYAMAGTDGDDVSNLVGWTVGTNAVVSNGTGASDVKSVLSESVDISNNFASFAFLTDLTPEDIDAIGSFCDEQNNEYMFVFDVDSTNYSDRIAAAQKHSGMCANYLDTSGLPAYLMPATILAATNYDKVNGTVNYMYQQFPNQTVAVDTDIMANKFDALKINYNGQTQKSGTKLEFYQDGYLADGTDIGVYANEIWLKDAMKTAILNLLIALDKLPANVDGIGLLEGALQDVASEAKNNGTISAEKEVTAEQKAYITQYTGDETAWQTIYLNGYVLSVDLTQDTSDGRTKYVAEYTLLYSKGDSIRKVEGTHTLI